MKKSGLVFWFTGLSGAGKSTTANDVAARLKSRGNAALVLDGDELRKRLHPALGFSAEEIRQNNARIADLCVSLRQDYDALLVAIISPFADSRRDARAKIGKGFYEVYFDAGLACVMQRDPKGLYARAASNQIQGMIGYSPDSPYEPPSAADCVVPAGNESAEACAAHLFEFVVSCLKSQPAA